MTHENTPDVRWAGRTDFAEVAEAVGVDTDHIMSVYAPGKGKPMLVLYTPEHEGEVWRCTVARNGEGILVADVAVECPGLMGRIKTALDEGLSDLDHLSMGGGS